MKTIKAMAVIRFNISITVEDNATVDEILEALHIEANKESGNQCFTPDVIPYEIVKT